MTDYLLDRERDEALERLRVLERLADPATRDHLERIGVGADWRCLEAGGGAGSIAAWLCERAASVVATDGEPRFLEALELPNLEVRRHDVGADPIEEAAFDLVHARNLLAHVPERDDALRKLARAVRPGGWILLEEPDVATEAVDPTVALPLRELHGKVLAAVHGFLREAGLDLNFGARLQGSLHALGFERLTSEGRVHGFRGGPETRSPHMMAFAQLREQVVGAGQVTDAEYGDFLALAADPEFAWREALTVSVRGRRAP